MAVSTTHTRNVLTGNGVATAFPFTFRLLSIDQVKVWRAVAGDPIAVPPAGYSIALNSSGNGGTVTLTGSPPAVGEQVIIERVVNYIQGVDINNQDGFYPKVVTDSLDKLTMAAQQIAASQSSSLRIASPGRMAELPPALSERAGRLLGFDAGGDPVGIVLAEGSVPEGRRTIVASGAGPALAITHLAAGGAPSLNLAVSEAMATPGAFYLAGAIVSKKTAGAGHREAFHTEQWSYNSEPSEFVVGMNNIGRVVTGSGNCFGGNWYSWVDATALATASCIGGESNTDARRSVITKAGLQIVDVATSVGTGTTYDAGIIIGSQPGAARYTVGIQLGFSTSGDSGYAVHDGGTLIDAGSYSGTLLQGINLSGITNWTRAPILLRPGARGMWFGTAGEGGRIDSEVTSGAGRIIFTANGLAMKDGSGNTVMQVQGSESYHSVLRTTGGFVLRRLVADGPDTAGAGYRNLKVEN